MNEQDTVEAPIGDWSDVQQHSSYFMKKNYGIVGFKPLNIQL